MQIDAVRLQRKRIMPILFASSGRDRIDQGTPPAMEIGTAAVVRSSGLRALGMVIAITGCRP
jgi:hypothetical protein